jgi:predicted DNA-binding protein
MTQDNTERFVKTFSGEKDTEAILQRLDRLSQNEARTTAAEILKVIYGLIRDMSE